MEKKETYLDKAKAKLDEQIDRLEKLKNAAKEEISEKQQQTAEIIDDVEKNIDAAKAHIKEISESAEDAWEDVKDKFEDINTTIGNSIKKFFGKKSKSEQPDETKPS